MGYRFATVTPPPGEKILTVPAGVTLETFITDPNVEKVVIHFIDGHLVTYTFESGDQRG